MLFFMLNSGGTTPTVFLFRRQRGAVDASLVIPSRETI